MDGGLLLELYTRDGVSGSSTMISTDFYEGIRRWACCSRAGLRESAGAPGQPGSAREARGHACCPEGVPEPPEQCGAARRAEVTDIDAITDLLTPLAVAGITRMRSRQDILADLHSFTVVQRENKVPLWPGRRAASA